MLNNSCVSWRPKTGCTRWMQLITSSRCFLVDTLFVVLSEALQTVVIHCGFYHLRHRIKSLWLVVFAPIPAFPHGERSYHVSGQCVCTTVTLAWQSRKGATILVVNGSIAAKHLAWQYRKWLNQILDWDSAKTLVCDMFMFFSRCACLDLWFYYA